MRTYNFISIHYIRTIYVYNYTYTPITIYYCTLHATIYNYVYTAHPLYINIYSY